MHIWKPPTLQPPLQPWHRKEASHWWDGRFTAPGSALQGDALRQPSCSLLQRKGTELWQVRLDSTHRIPINVIKVPQHPKFNQIIIFKKIKCIRHYSFARQLFTEHLLCAKWYKKWLRQGLVKAVSISEEYENAKNQRALNPIQVPATNWQCGLWEAF